MTALDADLPVRRLPAFHPVAAAQPEALSTAAVDPGAAQERLRAELEQAFAAELAGLREESRARGFREGYDDAFANVDDIVRKKEAELTAEYQSRLVGLTETIERLRALTEAQDGALAKALADLEPLVVDLAFAALARVLGHAEVYRAALVQVATQAIGEMTHQRSALRVLVHPHDATLLRAALESSPWADRFEADATLAPGSVLVEAGPRCLDASLLHQLEVVRECLVRVCAEREHA